MACVVISTSYVVPSFLQCRQLPVFRFADSMLASTAFRRGTSSFGRMSSTVIAATSSRE